MFLIRIRVCFVAVLVEPIFRLHGGIIHSLMDDRGGGGELAFEPFTGLKLPAFQANDAQFHFIELLNLGQRACECPPLAFQLLPTGVEQALLSDGIEYLKQAIAGDRRAPA